MAIDVHKALDPGLLGSTCQECLFYKLGEYKLGLLINFHVSLLKHGLKKGCEWIVILRY
jgi:hypothetical protein